MQTSNPEFDALSASRNRAHEYLVAIAGWPTLYSVSQATYALEDLTIGGDKLSQFTGIQPVAEPPKGAGASAKGRPEEGSQTIDALEIAILDKRLQGTRVGTELVSRPAYLFGNLGTSATTEASYYIPPDTTFIPATDNSAFDEGDVIYIGQECIKLGPRAYNQWYYFVNADGWTGCTRGYRLTEPTRHAQGATMYGFMPNLYRRPIFAYKGYQTMSSTKSFLRAFGGVVTSDSKANSFVKLKCAGNTWELRGDNKRKLATLKDPATGKGYHRGSSWMDSVYSADFDLVVDVDVVMPTPLADGHHVLKIDDAWFGISGHSDVTPNEEDRGDGVTRAYLHAVRGLTGAVGDVDVGTGVDVQIGWSNVDFSSTPLAGDEPVNLILKLLTSVYGDGENGTYDVFQNGIGLGIPQTRVDFSSFDAIRNAPDYDSNQRVFLIFNEPVDAKEFIEKELCRPFGYSLITGNDGLIRLIRHHSPQHIYTTVGNNVFTTNMVGNSAVDVQVQCGCYTPDEFAAELERALTTTVNGGFSVSFASGTQTFSVTNGGAFDITATTGWTMLGISAATNVTSVESASAVFGPDTVAATLTEADILDIAQQENRNLQVSSVMFKTHYNWTRDEFADQKEYVDAESVNLGDELGAHEYQIEAKGLYTSLGLGPMGLKAYSGGSPCDGSLIGQAASYAIDRDSSWAHNFALSLLHRYKQPPLILKAKLIWRWNTLELGDVIRLNYGVHGVVIDEELGRDYLDGRNFEISAITQNYADGTVDVTLVGHRYQGF